MSIVGDIFGVGGLAGFAKDLIDKLIPDPQAKAAALQKLQENQIEIIKMQDDLEAKLNETAGQNIRADAASGDKFTERARPTFMYIVEAILAFNFIVIPLIQMLSGKAVAPFNLPADLLTLFGVCVTGYVMSRSVDKALALPGDSQVNVLGVKLGNKS
jgi:hypothetical protein